MVTHPGHKTRFSDSSLYDEICIYCGATDARGSKALGDPCVPPHSLNPSAEESFFLTLHANPYDQATRNVYADWLEERDRVAEADYQRQQACQEYARRWLTWFLDRYVTRETGEVIEVGKLLNRLAEYLASNHTWGSIMLAYPGFDTETAMDDETLREQFWQAYEVLTSSKIDPAKRDNPFGCCL